VQPPVEVESAELGEHGETRAVLVRDGNGSTVGQKSHAIRHRCEQHPQPLAPQEHHRGHNRRPGQQCGADGQLELHPLVSDVDQCPEGGLQDAQRPEGRLQGNVSTAQ
jgi:hypothetical protein